MTRGRTKFWLLKSEPSVFSIDDLAAAPSRRTGWDGVRNYQARNNLRAMRRGDQALFYHSNAAPPAAMGIVRISREAYPDPTQFDPKHPSFDPRSARENPLWVQVDVAFVARFDRPVTLDLIRKTPALKGMALLKLSRLSVQPVTAAEWARVSALGGGER